MVLLILLLLQVALPDGNALAKRVLERQRKLEDTLNSYTYDVLERQQHLGSDGRAHSERARRYQVFYVHGRPIARRVEEDGHPLSPSAQKKEDERVARKVKDTDESTPDRAELRLSRILARYDFRTVGREDRDGRPTLVLDFSPRPGKSELAHDNVLRKVGGKAWVDEEEEQLVQAELWNTGGIKVAWGLGASVSNVQVRLGFRKLQNAWLPAEFSFLAEGHILVFKGFHVLTTETYSNYRRFEVDSNEELSR